ncbi:DnaK suppressor protein [Hahella chejuensis KCTC 2396]|uniref:DnaK suppressor protein n=1 Tax=Hahella chejuensis (strain KCTC 2396) TaxID=349521 RepID=Q2SPR7_HAHCH|nr:TraR/DksA C4-type zinc finger protein [Hahella chejuensis]ABC27357.1 DnaK suppressor protein [Hahella chejuensis KCTC 2396]
MQQSHIKNRLSEHLSVLITRLEDITRDLTSEHSADSAEQAQERENDDVLNALKVETEIEINQVKKALQRLQQGEYGVCVACGEDIPESRLQVLPFAELCVSCASKSE